MPMQIKWCVYIRALLNLKLITFLQCCFVIIMIPRLIRNKRYRNLMEVKQCVAALSADGATRAPRHPCTASHAADFSFVSDFRPTFVCY